jgi:hypothetical protein
MAVVLYQASGWDATPGDHAVVEADIPGPLQSARGEDRAHPGRPVLVAGSGRRVAGRGRGGGLEGDGGGG